MKTVADLKVGDTVWIQRSHSRGYNETTVEKIGRTLIHTCYRLSFKKDTLCGNGDDYNSRLILDLEQHEEDLKQAEVKRKHVYAITDKLRYGVRLEAISLENIISAAKLLDCYKE